MKTDQKYWKTTEVLEALQQAYSFPKSYFRNVVANRSFRPPSHRAGRNYLWTKFDIFRFEKFLKKNGKVIK